MSSCEIERQGPSIRAICATLVTPRPDEMLSASDKIQKASCGREPPLPKLGHGLVDLGSGSGHLGMRQSIQFLRFTPS